ncbi:cytochrome b5-like isoform X2 [Anopheles funestus]|uniref:Cytochrome b5 heme-binding domain-containing protein n=1 Tax=Anopheles funestus TaxID=62324 RepID=A0A7M5ECT2_ANOFN|nr:cytochrome b5-like isoform X2 [Anopheles funestus]
MAPTELKQYSLAEVSQHNKPEDVWMVIHDKVYDVTKFLHEHPGGEEVLIEWAGKEATAEFDDVGHSSDAKEQMKQFLVGELIEADRKKKSSAGSVTDPSSNASSTSSSWFGSIKAKFFG